jgi:predicted permease
MQVLTNILPMSIIIGLGLLAARIGLFPVEFIKTASKLVFFLGLPCLAFRAVVKAPLEEALVMHSALLGGLAIFIQWVLGIILARLFLTNERVPRPRRVSWVASQIHGNMGIMGIAVVYYVLGESWLGHGALVMAVLMLVHTFLAVLLLSVWGNGGGGVLQGLAGVLKNPVILGVVAGLVGAYLGIKLPGFVDRTVNILANMALPLALLVIGAELSLWRFDSGKRDLATMSFMKLVVLPAIGLGLLRLAGISAQESAVTIVMLASPCATVTVILANLMGGDSRFAAAGISFTHAIAPVFYFLWLSLLLG